MNAPLAVTVRASPPLFLSVTEEPLAKPPTVPPTLNVVVEHTILTFDTSALRPVPEPLEAVQICAKRIRKDKCITTIVFCTRYAMAIAKPIQLLRVNREHRITPLGQALHYSSTGDLDCDSDSIHWLHRLLCNPS